MENLPISLTVSNTGDRQPLDLKISIDNVVLWSGAITDLQQINVDAALDDGDHVLTLHMSGKAADYTVLDHDNNIVSDACLEFKNIEFEGINVDHILQEHSEYSHNFNGHKGPAVEKFYHCMGCEGTVSLQFTSPAYLWMLDHM